MSVEGKPVAPFILSVTAGVLILLGAVVMSMFTFGVTNLMTGMMSSMQGGMGMTGMMMNFAPILTILGLASGSAVTLGSVMLYARPLENQVWGAVILAFSIMSILGGLGGFLVGMILGVVGGSLALSWKPGTHPSA